MHLTIKYDFISCFTERELLRVSSHTERELLGASCHTERIIGIFLLHRNIMIHCSDNKEKRLMKYILIKFLVSPNKYLFIATNFTSDRMK